MSNEIPRQVMIGNGRGTKRCYYLWEELNDMGEARRLAIEIKVQEKIKGIKVKSFIIPYNDKLVGLYFTRGKNGC